MLLKDVGSCSTHVVRGLDYQLIAQMNRLIPGLLVPITDLNVALGEAAHNWIQAPAKECLRKALNERGKRMVINSTYRTLAQQFLLRRHYEKKRCGIILASHPGKSPHNSGAALDIEDSLAWRVSMERSHWKWLGSHDPMHFDCRHPGIKSIHSVSVRAFQICWNQANPRDRLAEDGDFGLATANKLKYSPIEGFANLEIPRILCFTDPLQIGNDVGEVQLSLRKIGVELQKADKIFGKATEAAVKFFQSRNGLTPDGIVGRITRERIVSAVG